MNGFVDGQDKVDLSQFDVAFADLNIANNAGDALITIDGFADFSIRLDGISVASLTAADFVF